MSKLPVKNIFHINFNFPYFENSLIHVEKYKQSSFYFH